MIRQNKNSTKIEVYLGVSKNRGGPPKWMVYNGKLENPIKMDDLGENPPFSETPIMFVPRVGM